MVKVVDVTEEKKAKVERTAKVMGLAKKLFGETSKISNVPDNFISVRLNGGNIVADVWEGPTPIVTVYSPAHYKNAEALAKEYEKIVGREVELITDYSEGR